MNKQARTYQTDQLLADLENRIYRLIFVVKEELEPMDTMAIRRRPALKSWSALEALEHTTLTLKNYLPRLRKAVAKAQKKGWVSQPFFSLSRLGAWAVEIISPTPEGKIRYPRRTSAGLRPSVIPEASQQTIGRYLDALEDLVQLIRGAKEVNIGRARLKMMMPFVKINLGEALMVNVGHAERHMLQAKRAISHYHGELRVPKEVL